MYILLLLFSLALLPLSLSFHAWRGALLSTDQIRIAKDGAGFTEDPESSAIELPPGAELAAAPLRRKTEGTSAISP